MSFTSRAVFGVPSLPKLRDTPKAMAIMKMTRAPKRTARGIFDVSTVSVINFLI
jgi:hypothetical protein